MTSPEAPGQQPETALRVDAERNRERILAAARRLYATEGLGVSMASVARAADVGKATLSRRFATREDLINAVFADRMDGYTTAITEALADPDPWHAFTHYVHTICAMQAADRGFADVLTMTFPTAEALETRRAESYQGFLELIARAKATGHLRADFAAEDFVVLLMANAEVREFLISRRAHITPEQAGLPHFGGNRRVPGLRREEVATLAGAKCQ